MRMCEGDNDQQNLIIKKKKKDNKWPTHTNVTNLQPTTAQLLLSVRAPLTAFDTSSPGDIFVQFARAEQGIKFEPAPLVSCI